MGWVGSGWVGGMYICIYAYKLPTYLPTFLKKNQIDKKSRVVAILALKYNKGRWRWMRWVIVLCREVVMLSLRVWKEIGTWLAIR